MDLPYQKCFDAMPCYLTVQDRDLKLIKANQRFRRDFGDWEGRYCYQVYKRRSERCEVCSVEKTFRDGQSYSSEEHVKSLNGMDVSVLINTEPIRDDAGEIVAVMEMSTDVSEMKRMENLLRESQEKYQTLFSEAPCYISIQDRELNIVEANRLHREDFGTYYGCKCYQVYKHRDEACFPCTIQETFEDGQVRIHEEVVTNQRGEAINVLVNTTPIRNAAGRITHVMELSANITQIRELESKLNSIGLLIGSVSHNVKGLLNSLNGGMYLVNNGLASNNQARIKQGWEIVQRNVERIRSTMLDILYYSKDRELTKQEISPVHLMNEVAELFGARAAELGIDFRCEPTDDAGAFEADPKALRALLVNLIENSLDACRVDKKKEKHSVSAHLTGSLEEIRFEIQDNGIGMDRETCDKAFSLFFSSKGNEGTGMGLFVANKIAKMHGGGIRIESEVDVGTKFIVTIPRSIGSPN